MAQLLETLKYFLTGQARSQYERQSAAASAREQATQSLLSRLKGPRRWLFTHLLPWAQRYAPPREDALAEVGLGRPFLRRMLREVGRRLVAAGSLAKRDSVTAPPSHASIRSSQCGARAWQRRGSAAGSASPSTGMGGW